MRPRSVLVLAWLCSLAGCVLLFGASAQALEVHQFAGSFGTGGSGAGQFDKPQGIAVSDTTHDVYVVDTNNNRVEEFNSTGSTLLGEFNGSAAPTGAFSNPTEIAIDNSTSPFDPSAGDVYVVDSGHGVIDKFSPTGTYEGQLTGSPSGPFLRGEALMGVAVAPSGEVWVVQGQIGKTDNFSDGLENKYLSERPTFIKGGPGGSTYSPVAIDAENNIYVDLGSIVKVNSAGEELPVHFGEEQVVGEIHTTGVAVDSTGREVYVDTRDTADHQGTAVGSISAYSLNGTPIENFGSEHLATEGYSGVAVNESAGTVYATNPTADSVEIFEAVFLPSVAVKPLTEQQPRSVTLNGTVNPEGKPVTSCVFEYGPTGAYGQSVPCSPANLGSGTSPVTVSAHLTGLTPESTYHWRLVAENATHVSSPTADQQLVAGPILGDQSVVDVASSSATLQAPLDPNGADTHYYFQYGTSTSYGTYVPISPPGAGLGAAAGAQTVSVHLDDLEAGTLYHFRFVALQAGETFEEADDTFTTQTTGAASLIDGRAWELVSPANKKGALIELFENGGQLQAASDGSAITYVAQGPNLGEGPQGNGVASQVLSRRGPMGWVSEDLTLPGRLPENGESATNISVHKWEYRLFSPDLSSAVVEPQEAGTPPLSSEATERTLYLRDDATKDFLPLVTAGNVPSGTRIEEPTFLGISNLYDDFEMHFLAATPDASHVVFKTPLALTSDAIDEESVQKHANGGTIQTNLYEWGGGDLQLVNILPPPGNEIAHGQGSAGFPVVSLAGNGFTGDDGYPEGDVQRNVSNDGRRIAWTWGQPAGSQGGSRVYKGLYVRDMVEERTVRVGGASAIYQTMNGDGSKIFFLENGDLYEYDYETGTQTDLTGVHGPGESSAGVQELVSDVSEDGSYVYFVATGVLANGGVSGKDNLYLLHDTAVGWTTTLIAGLSPGDEPSWDTGAAAATQLYKVSSRVSPDGRYLAFMSDRSLTGYDNTDAVSGQPDEEVYLYDAQTSKLVCASCDPTGARPVGVLDTEAAELAVDRAGVWNENSATTKRTAHWLAGSIPGWDQNEHTSTYQPRYLSNSGRLFFDSPDALVPRDTNGLEDVYEYEPADVSGGSGACTTESATFSDRSDGCIGLISSGTSSSESVFYDASENGDDAFFATTGKLVGEDYDKGYDLYDAHVCTSAMPCRSEPSLPPPCTSGDSCKAAPSPQPEIFGSTPSATFRGAGNVVASSPGSAVTSKSLTNAQKLARALKDCHRKKRNKRGVCERQAKKRYAVESHKNTTTRKAKG